LLGGTDGALIDDGACLGLIEGFIVSLAVEEGVHEDEGGADHDQVDVGVEEEEDAEGEVLIFMFVADDFKSPIDWS
jgi:hypothetical protein